MIKNLVLFFRKNTRNDLDVVKLVNAAFGNRQSRIFDCAKNHEKQFNIYKDECLYAAYPALVARILSSRIVLDSFSVEKQDKKYNNRVYFTHHMTTFIFNGR